MMGDGDVIGDFLDGVSGIKPNRLVIGVTPSEG
jgi:hypothetical protein